WARSTSAAAFKGVWVSSIIGLINLISTAADRWDQGNLCVAGNPCIVRAIAAVDCKQGVGQQVIQTWVFFLKNLPQLRHGAIFRQLQFNPLLTNGVLRSCK